MLGKIAFSGSSDTSINPKRAVSIFILRRPYLYSLNLNEIIFLARSFLGIEKRKIRRCYLNENAI